MNLITILIIFGMCLALYLGGKIDFKEEAIVQADSVCGQKVIENHGAILDLCKHKPHFNLIKAENIGTA